MNNTDEPVNVDPFEPRYYADGSNISIFKLNKWAAYYPGGVRHNWLFDDWDSAELQMKKEGFCKGEVRSTQYPQPVDHI